MKFCQFIIVGLVLQGVSCGVIDYVDEAYDSVRDKFRNFLGVLRSDFTLAVDCTIFAVEQLILSDDEEYRQRCQQHVYPTDDVTSNAIDTSTQEKNKVIDTMVREDFRTTSSQLNNNLNNVIQGNDIRSKLNMIRDSLNSQSTNLHEVNSYLRDKLNNLYPKVSDNKPIIGNSSIFEAIWSNLQTIHKAKRSNSTKDFRVNEIDNFVNNILAIVQKNGTDPAGKAKINTMIDTLVNDINGREKPVDVPKIDVSIENKLIVSTEAPAIIETKNNNNLESNVNNLEVENVPEQENDEVKNTPLNAVEELIKPETVENPKKTYSDYFNTFNSDFGSNSGAAAIPVARSNEARDVIKQYKMSESIINKYFDNPEYVVGDLSSKNDDYFNDLFDNFRY